MASRDSPLLVLGVLPSEKQHVNWSSEVARAARSTWQTLPAPSVLLRFVLRDEGEVSDERAGDIVRVPLPPRSTCLCAELTHAWFVHALRTWPTAKWYGKTEDHIYVQTTVLQWELERLPHAQPVWLGLFFYSSVGGVRRPDAGCWGGQFEDDATASDQTTQQLVRVRVS